MDVIETELLLRDLETAQRRAERTTRAARSGDKALQREAEVSARLLAHLQAGEPARTFTAGGDEQALLRELGLLTAKPMLYAANVAESDLPGGDNSYVHQVRALAKEQDAEVVIICAEVEAQIAELPADDRADFLADLGLERSGLDRLVTAAYRLLGLLTFFTAGPKEARAWTVPAGTRAPQAAGTIHSDMERGFIRAEVISFDDYARLGSESAARDAGRLRVEGKEYVVADGDVMHFRFNV